MFNYSKISLLLVVLTAFLASPAQAECPVGDLDDNCKVDADDVRIFAGQWLGGGSLPANIDGS
ncbi:MAG: hypothetical protein ACYS1A_17120, partial [Planctomycetota bacterium]